METIEEFKGEYFFLSNFYECPVIFMGLTYKNWESVKDRIMLNIVRAKFIRNQDLFDKIVATGVAKLIEGNWWGDKYWGMCNGEGINMLGKILMFVRSECRDLSIHKYD